MQAKNYGALVLESREEGTALFPVVKIRAHALLTLALAGTTPTNMLMFFAMKALSSKSTINLED